MIAYEHMEAQLRRDLIKPRSDMTWQELVDSVRETKDLWKDIYRYPNSQLPNTITSTTTMSRSYPNSTYRSRGQYSKGFSTLESRTQKFTPNNNFTNNRPFTLGLYTEGRKNVYHSQHPQNSPANRNYQPNQRAFSDTRPIGPNRQPLRITDGRYAGSSQPPRFDNAQRQIKAYKASIDSEPTPSNDPANAPVDNSYDHEQVENFPFAEDTYQDEYNQEVEDDTLLPESTDLELHGDPSVFWASTPIVRTCNNCQTKFTLNNKLHKHIKERSRRKKVDFKTPVAMASTPE